MVADGPDEYDRRDWINEGEHQAAIEGRRGPKRRGFAQAEGVREQGAVRHSRIAEEAVDGVEEGVQSARILAFDPVARSDALPERVVILPLARADRLGSRPEHAEIMQDGEAESGNSDQDHDADQCDQRRADRRLHLGPEIVPKRSENDAKNCGKHRRKQSSHRRLAQIRPSMQQNRRTSATRPCHNYSAILPASKRVCCDEHDAERQ